MDLQTEVRQTAVRIDLQTAVQIIVHLLNRAAEEISYMLEF
jgi:phosphosulfolactate phosphohydrolase-like enzyme